MLIVELESALERPIRHPSLLLEALANLGKKCLKVHHCPATTLALVPRESNIRQGRVCMGIAPRIYQESRGMAGEMYGTRLGAHISLEPMRPRLDALLLSPMPLLEVLRESTARMRLSLSASERPATKEVAAMVPVLIMGLSGQLVSGAKLIELNASPVGSTPMVFSTASRPRSLSARPYTKGLEIDWMV
jgi:hypothetical protein